MTAPEFPGVERPAPGVEYVPAKTYVTDGSESVWGPYRQYKGDFKSHGWYCECSKCKAARKAEVSK